MREQDAWLCFADESGQSLRPPKARTWAPRGVTPAVRVGTRRDRRVCLVSAVCCRPGERTRLVYRLLDAMHQQLACRPIVLVWDNSPQHTDRAMRALLAERSWLTVFQLPAYAPDLNPDEGVWAHLKKTLANLAPCTIDQLATLIRTRLKRMQYRPALLDGFIAETGLVLTP